MYFLYLVTTGLQKRCNDALGLYQRQHRQLQDLVHATRGRALDVCGKNCASKLEGTHDKRYSSSPSYLGSKCLFLKGPV